MVNLILVLLLSAAGGLCQSVTGFGSAIIMMTLLPELFFVNVAAGITTLICCPLGVFITYHYRDSFRLERVILPVLVFSIFSYVAVRFALYVDAYGLKAVLGGLLILLSIYFFFFADRLSIRPSVLSAVICSALAGLMGGLFAIGGPLLVLYFLGVTESKEEYMVCVNSTLLMTNLIQTLERVHAGIVTAAELPAVCFGIVGVTIGFYFGSGIADRINIALIKKLVYGFLGIVGLLTLFDAIQKL